MTVELKPETERLLQEEIRSGRVQSVDELIVYGIQALREKSRPRKMLYDLLTQPPFAASELNLERLKD